MVIHILYWNTHRRPGLTQLALWARGAYDVIALSEAARNNTTQAPACPSNANYHMVFHSGRAALYIHKRHGPGTWTHEAGEDWASVTLTSPPCRIISIYNPPDSNGDSPALRALAGTLPDDQTILIGDFNFHHPMWDLHGRNTPGSEVLLRIATRLRVALATPQGTITRTSHNQRTSTLDLAWASHGLQAQYAGTDYNLDGSDHFPQLLRVGDPFNSPPQPNSQQREDPPAPNWKMTDPKAARREAAVRLRWTRGDITTEAGLDDAVDWLIHQLHEIATFATPRRRRSGPARNPWWNRDTALSTKRLKQARRRFQRTGHQTDWRELCEAGAHQERAVSDARRASWRQILEDTRPKPAQLWRIERWARLRSGIAPAPPQLPPLERPGLPPATTHKDKAKVLAARFFPKPWADNTDLPPLLPDSQRAGGVTAPVLPQVSPDDIKDVLKKIQSWKAPGADGLPAGFLKACGDSFTQTLAIIAEASFALGHYPARFRTASVTVIPKPGKTPAQQRTARGWRPISLLSVIGKIIESVLGNRIATAAEQAGLLPDGQMGNRAKRSTELALAVTVEATRAAWDRRGITSLLQLDFTGAFDTVDHQRLVATLQEMGFPAWVAAWAKSFLTARTARLRFEDELSDPFDIQAGVPQGSPLSPILFILYITSLYTELRQAEGIIVVGFADDTNLLAFGHNTDETRARLEAAWEICARWAKKNGMTFEQDKAKLLHFTRKRAADTTRVRLGTDIITPVQSCRFLGLWLHRKLLWGPHITELKGKLERQRRALYAIAASTWGVHLAGARLIYVQVIRTAIAYGASTCHTPTAPGGKPKGLARALAPEQTRALRVVGGAYKATPTRLLESELGVPPLDIYLNERVAAYHERIENQQTARLIRTASAAAARWIKRKKRKTPWRKPMQELKSWATAWMPPTFEAQWGPGSAPVRSTIEWNARWNRLDLESMDQRTTNRRQAAETEPIFSGQATARLHHGLNKYESSMLIQLRTGRLGLRQFLFERHVPEVATPLCRCGLAPETAEHIFLKCELYRAARASLQNPPRTRRDLHSMLSTQGPAQALTRWFLHLQVVPQFNLALKLHSPDNYIDSPHGPDPPPSLPLQRGRGASAPSI